MGQTLKYRLSATVSKPVIARATRVAKSLGMSRSALVEEALVGFLEQAEMHAKLLGDTKVMAAFAKAMSEPGVMSQLAKVMGEEINDKQQMQLRQLLEGLGKVEGAKK